jgi:hypothetical protein
MTTRTPAMIAAALEVTVGSALIVNPGLVVHLLIGAGLSSGGDAVGRVGGFGLLSLGLACWPSTRLAAAQATSASFIYCLLSAIYVGSLSVVGGFVGHLLWPAFVLYAVLAPMLAVPVYGAARREWIGMHFPKITIQIVSEIALSPKEKTKPPRTQLN